LHPADGRKSEVGTGDDFSGEKPLLTEDILETGLCELMDLGGDRFAPSHFGGNDDFALTFGFDGEESGACDVGIEESEVTVPGHGSGNHLAALFEVFDEVHVSAGVEIESSSAGVDIDDNVAQRKEDGSEIMGDHFGRSSEGIAGEATIEVLAVQRRESGCGLGGGHIECGDEDDASGEFVELKFPEHAHDGNLSGIFVAVVSCHDEGRFSLAAIEDGDRNDEVGPPGQVVRVGDVEGSVLDALFFVIDGRADLRFFHSDGICGGGCLETVNPESCRVRTHL